jgi:hypothetical protein
MRKFFESILSMLSKLLPLILILLSLYIYMQLMQENKKLNQRIESLTNLVSYKMNEIIKSSESKK